MSPRAAPDWNRNWVIDGENEGTLAEISRYISVCANRSRFLSGNREIVASKQNGGAVRACPHLTLETIIVSADQQDSQGVIHKLLPFTTVAVVLAAIYVGYIFYSRWSEKREAQEKSRQQQIADAQKTVEAYGNGQVKVLNFTISPGAPAHGEKVTICYGVSNAKTVTIDPKPENGVWPSLSRCVAATPTRDTTYTITATDAAGHTDTQSLAIKVH